MPGWADPFSLVLVAVGVLVAGALKGASGVGFPSIATPVVATVLGARTAGIVLALPGFLLNVTQWVRLGLSMAELRSAAWYLAGTAAGVLAGTWVMLQEGDLPLGTLLGAMGLLYAGHKLWRPDVRLSWAGTRLGGLLIGLAGGALKGATNVTGPLVVVYLQQRQLHRDAFASLSSFIIQFTGGFRLLLLLWAGVFDWQTALYSAALVIPGLAGLFIGDAVRARMSEQVFSRFTTLLVGVLSVVLIIKDLTE